MDAAKKEKKEKSDKKEKKDKKDKKSKGDDDALSVSTTATTSTSVTVTADNPPAKISSGSTVFRLLMVPGATGDTPVYIPDLLLKRFSVTAEKLSTVREVHPFAWKAKWDGNKSRFYYVNVLDKTQKVWKLVEVDPESYPQGGVASRSGGTSPVEAATPVVAPRAASPSAVDKPKVSGWNTLRAKGLSAARSAASGTTASDSSPSKEERKKYKLIFGEVDSDETISRTSLSSAEAQGWSELIVNASSSTQEARIQMEGREDSERVAARLKLEQVEEDERSSYLMSVEDDCWTSLEASNAMQLDALKTFEMRHRAAKLIDDRHRIQDIEGEERDEIVGDERSDYAIAAVTLYEGVRETGVKERQAADLARVNELVSAMLDDEEEDRGTISRTEGNHRVKLAADEARASVTLNMEKTAVEREEEADTRAKNLLLSEWVDSCFFSVVSEYMSFCLSTTRMWQEFAHSLATGRMPAIRFEDLAFDPPSFLEHKWKTLQDYDTKKQFHQNHPAPVVPSQQELSPPRGPKVANQTPATVTTFTEPFTEGHQPGVGRTGSSPRKHNPHSKEGTRVEMWKSGLEDFLQRQRDTGHILYDSEIRSNSSGMVVHGSIYDPSAATRIETCIERHAKRQAAALEVPLKTPDVPSDVNKSIKDFSVSANNSGVAAEGLRFQSEASIYRKHQQPYPSPHRPERQPQLYDALPHHAAPKGKAGSTALDGVDMDFLLGTAVVSGGSNPQPHTQGRGANGAAPPSVTSNLQLRHEWIDGEKKNADAALVVEAQSRNSAVKRTASDTSSVAPRPQMVSEDLVWDDFQSRGVMLTDNGLTARFFPRPTVGGTVSPRNNFRATRDAFAAGSIGIAKGRFLWEVRVTRPRWEPLDEASTQYDPMAATGPSPRTAFQGDTLTPPSVRRAGGGAAHRKKLMVGMASRLFTGPVSSEAPAYFFLEDGTISCSPDGSDATAFGDPFFGRNRDREEAIVTIDLNMDSWELSFAINGAPQGVAFKFSPMADPEPLFPLVVIGGEGQTATLRAPSALTNAASQH